MNEELELLGCLLVGANPADCNLTPEDFYEPRNGAIYAACVAVADSGRRPDPQSVAIEMGAEAHKLPGGVVHLVELAERSIPQNAAAFAARVRTESERRALVQVAQRIMQHAAERDPGDLAEDARKWLDRPTAATTDTRRMGDMLPEITDRAERGQQPGLSTPWPDLDRLLHGLHPGRLYTVGGRPGGGKSVMLTNLAAHFAGKHGTPALFCTLEMPDLELAGRVVASVAQVAQTNLTTGQMSDLDWQRLQRASTALTEMNLHICDASSQSVRSIRRTARDIQRKYGLGLIVVDYLQLITPPDRRLSRQQQIGEVTRALKQLAKEFSVPVLTASQLRRPGDGKVARPTMSDLRESGDIEADSDVIILLHSPDDSKPWDLEAVVAKNRSGPRGPVQLMFDASRASMQPAEWKYSA